MSSKSIADSWADVLFSAKRKVLGRDRARRGRLYCVGTGKSGTHSVAAMFSKTVRARHEARALELLEKMLEWKNGRMSEAEFTAWLHVRDREMGLEVDSSTLNFDILDILLREFPDARFVLTIRDCYSWCNSHLNHTIRFSGEIDQLWYEMARVRFQDGPLPHASEERLLAEKGFQSLAYYFSRWARHNTEVLAKVPPDRLLVVRTDEINQRALEIAEFGGFPRRSICLDRTHAYKNPEKQPLLLQLDRAFVEATADRHCRPLMERFFPEITSLESARF
jgi:hypothetical protein